MAKLTHFNRKGEAQMVDVGTKTATRRVAIAEGQILMHPETVRLIREGGHKKGDVLAVARIAGIMAAKKTAELIPLCHPLMLTHVEVELQTRPQENCVHCQARVETHDKTGVEMEALSAVQTALLTVYDMCKSVDRGMTIESVRLIEKSGGSSGTWTRKEED
ncbi:MAG: cyclic pyranopterin monophosphate synthase MoaC [Gammaproteobacteria bacterium]